ncbi:MAG: flagellar assembly lytic transglycosylase [Spirochaetia bacterium]
MRPSLFLALVLLLTGCETEPELLGMDYDASMSRIERSDYSFLSEVDVSRISADSVHGIEEGSAYYLGRIFEETGHPDSAFHLYDLQWQTEDSAPWRGESGRRIIELADSESQKERALGVAERLHGAHEEEASLVLARADLLLALERWEEVAALEQYATLAPGLYTRLAYAALELADTRTARDHLHDALADTPSDDTHSELAEGFEGAESSVRESFEDWVAPYLEFRANVAEREWSDALEVFEDLNADFSVPAEILLSREGITDIREAHFRGNRPNEGASFFESSVDRAPEDTAHYVLESAGRLYRNSGERRKAMQALSEAASRAGDPEAVDDALYHYVHESITVDPAELVAELDELLPRIADSSRFDGAFERLIANIIPQRRWDLLRQSYASIRRHASERTVAQFGVAYATALRAGYVSRPDEAESAASAERYLLDPAAEQRESPYYALLASVMLGRVPHALPGDPAAEREVVPGPDDELVAGYLDFGLVTRAYDAVYREDRRTGASVTERLARRLAEDGALLRSLRIANRLSRIEDVVADRELSKLIYPLAYEQALTEVSEEYDIPRNLYYGLVREESYFDASIQSHAGASGLAQLMPATAGDVAARLGVTEYDLTDPETNLRFGARYLSDLYASFSRWVPSLIAYNAGQGRVRRWQSLQGDLPMILFHESVPLGEPREYIRKVLVSAVNYAYLYEDSSVQETVQQFFPDIIP